MAQIVRPKFWRKRITWAVIALMAFALFGSHQVAKSGDFYRHQHKRYRRWQFAPSDPRFQRKRRSHDRFYLLQHRDGLSDNFSENTPANHFDPGVHRWNYTTGICRHPVDSTGRGQHLWLWTATRRGKQHRPGADHQSLQFVWHLAHFKR